MFSKDITSLGIEAYLKKYADKGEHIIVGTASSIRDVARHAEEKIEPSVFLIEDLDGQGAAVAGFAGQVYPNVVLIALAPQKQPWSEFNISKQQIRSNPTEFVEFLTNLEHDDSI